MIFFNFSNEKNLNISDAEFNDFLKTKKNGIFLCQDSELNRIAKAYDFPENTIKKTNNVDELVRYSTYQNFDFISVVLYCNDGVANEINIFFNHKSIFFFFPNNGDKEINLLRKDFISKIRINEKKQKNTTELISYIIYKFFDAYIFNYTLILEKIEDKIELLQNEILKKVEDEQIGKITSLSERVYKIKKYIRSLNYVVSMLNDEENIYFGDINTPSLSKIEARVDSLFSYTDTIYTSSQELIRMRDSKINNNTNKLITRLTIITVIMGVWTIVTGFFGMNFDNKSIDWEWYYLIVFGVLIIISIVSIIVAIKKKVF